jgi:hypothetical protein
MSFLLLLIYSSTKLEKGQNRFCLEASGWREEGGGGGQGREMAQTMYTDMNT